MAVRRPRARGIGGARLAAALAALVVLVWFTISKDSSLLGQVQEGVAPAEAATRAVHAPPATATTTTSLVRHGPSTESSRSEQRLGDGGIAANGSARRSYGSSVVGDNATAAMPANAAAEAPPPSSVDAVDLPVEAATHNMTTSASSSPLASAPASIASTIIVSDGGGNRTFISVISYSVFGTNDRYLVPLLYNIRERVPRYYPGWQVRIYHDGTVPAVVLDELRSLPRVRLVNVADVGKPTEPLLPPEWGEWLPTINPLVWRFLVSVDPTVDRYIIRDSDSLVEFREKAAVDEWIESGAPFHVMHDHPRHYAWSNKNVTMLAGMWGGRRIGGPGLPLEGGAGERFREDMIAKGGKGNRMRLDMTSILKKWYGNPIMWKSPKTGTYLRGDDQNLLSYRVWPSIQRLGPGGSTRHNSFHCESNDGVAFPTAGVWDLGGYDFIGDVAVFEPNATATGGWSPRDRNHRSSGACWMKSLVVLGSGPRKQYAKCLRRREALGYRNASEIVLLPPPPPTGCARDKGIKVQAVKVGARRPLLRPGK